MFGLFLVLLLWPSALAEAPGGGGSELMVADKGPKRFGGVGWGGEKPGVLEGFTMVLCSVLGF